MTKVFSDHAWCDAIIEYRRGGRVPEIMKA
jgi:hypothetical protein